MSARHAWPIAVVAVLAITVVANVAVLRLAGDEDAAAVEPQYYAKALRWDSTLVARKASDELGWRAEVSLARTGGGAGRTTVMVRLADETGAPLEGAFVRVEAIHNRHAAHPLHAVLQAAPSLGPGAYAADAAFDAPGMWEIRLEARRGEEVFVDDVRRELEARP
jgi:nitrogen fixation protein FixH